jgi:REP element-mobilizing transposase RayT
MKPYAIHDQAKPYYMTWTIVDWIDIFTRQRYRDIVIESLKYCMEHKGLILYAYVIMSNHIHLIACAQQGFSYQVSPMIARNLLPKPSQNPYTQSPNAGVHGYTEFDFWLGKWNIEQEIMDENGNYLKLSANNTVEKTVGPGLSLSLRNSIFG